MPDPEHYVFLDLSYLVFHRFFAIVSWAKLTKKELSDNEFKDRFAKGFEDYFLKVKKKLGLKTFKNVYVVSDTSRNLIWRTKIFPDYKKNRDENKQKFDPTIFAYMHDSVIPNLKTKFEFNEISIVSAEADDIIAVSCKYIRSTSPCSKITIITNDNDFVQLTLEPVYANVYNASWVDIAGRFNNEMLSVYTEWKVIKGDKSDNIPAIDKKIGDKVALKLATNKDLLSKRLENPVVLKQYNLNKALIDFESIPVDLVKNIEKALKKVI